MQQKNQKKPTNFKNILDVVKRIWFLIIFCDAIPKGQILHFAYNALIIQID